MEFKTATQFDPIESEHIGFFPVGNDMLTHKADSKTRKTECGLDVGVYNEGWMWGGEVNCEECTDV